jgi:O-antigen/teichoic acid export membrane protein
MLRLLAAALVICLGFIVLGAIMKALFWLLIIGVVLFVATAAVGTAKAKTMGKLRR